jgi:acetyl-CoA C-acetyltransferase
VVLDPRTPVLVGVGQVTIRPGAGDVCPEPAVLMGQAARLAGEDSGSGDVLLRRADSVQVVQLLSWRYSNPALDLAGRIGASPRETVQSAVGGNSPQQLVNEAAVAIRAGRADVVLIAGGEAVHTRHAAHRSGTTLPWPQQPAEGPAPDRIIGSDRRGMTDDEAGRAVVMPVHVYPVFENALRLAEGESVEAHQRRVSELWAGFSDVASANPYAWDRQPHTAEQIRTAGPGNRWIAWPYPRMMNAFSGVDMAGALLLTSVEAATAAGVPDDRWVFPWAGADSHDHWSVSERWDLRSSPAMAANGRAALGLAGIGIDDVAHVDLYSCFPSAVQMGAAGLGLQAAGRPLTVTGGLAFAGGPWNNYVTHSIASMAEVLRADPGSIGVTTALGWFATKHSIGVYSTTPPASGFGHAHPQAEVDALPSRRAAVGYEGSVTVESWSVPYEREGTPAFGLVSCLTPDGGRWWANTRRPDVIKALLTGDPGGAAATLEADGELDL